MVGIYKITSPSGNVYIGQSRNIKKRWDRYKRGHTWKNVLPNVRSHLASVKLSYKFSGRHGKD